MTWVAVSKDQMIDVLRNYGDRFVSFDLSITLQPQGLFVGLGETTQMVWQGVESQVGDELYAWQLWRDGFFTDALWGDMRRQELRINEFYGGYSVKSLRWTFFINTDAYQPVNQPVDETQPDF
jgi:hypothetical protein